jgi:hypothetical protein
MQTWKSKFWLIKHWRFSKQPLLIRSNPSLPPAQPAGAIEKYLNIPEKIVDENALQRDLLVADLADDRARRRRQRVRIGAGS